jgi:hypothetical protein
MEDSTSDLSYLPFHDVAKDFVGAREDKSGEHFASLT